MAKRRTKKRTHLKADEEEVKKIPKSMVINLAKSSRHHQSALSSSSGVKSHSLNQLVRDFRQVMQPHTAIRLRERKKNKLKDFVVMCGPLGVSHLILFNQSALHDTETSITGGYVNLRIVKYPRGPTFTFRVKNYSLCKDIAKFLKTPKSLSNKSPEFAKPPLLVMNSFHVTKSKEDEQVDVHMKVDQLTTTMFQNMFPPISVQKTNVDSLKRVLLLNKDSKTGCIELRHYAIDTKTVDVSKPIKHIMKSKSKLQTRVPNLKSMEDVSDLFLQNYTGYATSDSEVEDEEIVKLTDRKTKKRIKVKKEESTEKTPLEDSTEGSVRKKAIKLTELGPRMLLELIKIEEGISEGKILYHKYVEKTKQEEEELEKIHKKRRDEKIRRRKEQEANVEKKKKKTKKSKSDASTETPANEELPEQPVKEEDLSDDELFEEDYGSEQYSE